MVYSGYVYLFKCLSHRSRIRLMHLLATNGEMAVTSIAKAFEGEEMEDRDASTISRNLNMLKQHGFVASRREGRTKYYSLNLSKIEKDLGAFVQFLKGAKLNKHPR